MIDSRKYGRCQLIQGNLAKQKKNNNNRFWTDTRATKK